jgi:predicted signal transduction protein with EAL and GGDEF domain
LERPGISRAIPLWGRLGRCQGTVCTGYASLSSLQSFPFDKIKIDRSFVSGVNSNAQSAAIVRTVLSLGTTLNIPVIAEGVETEAERVFLMKEGCVEVQGFLVGHPMSIAGYAELTNGMSPGVIDWKTRSDPQRSSGKTARAIG